MANIGNSAPSTPAPIPPAYSANQAIKLSQAEGRTDPKGIAVMISKCFHVLPKVPSSFLMFNHREEE